MNDAKAVIKPSFMNSIISSSVSSLKYVLYRKTRNELTATKDAIAKNPVNPVTRNGESGITKFQRANTLLTQKSPHNADHDASHLSAPVNDVQKFFLWVKDCCQTAKDQSGRKNRHTCTSTSAHLIIPVTRRCEDLTPNPHLLMIGWMITVIGLGFGSACRAGHCVIVERGQELRKRQTERGNNQRVSDVNGWSNGATRTTAAPAVVNDCLAGGSGTQRRRHLVLHSVPHFACRCLCLTHTHTLSLSSHCGPPFSNCFALPLFQNQPPVYFFFDPFFHFVPYRLLTSVSLCWDIVTNIVMASSAASPGGQSASDSISVCPTTFLLPTAFPGMSLCLSPSLSSDCSPSPF